MSLANLNLKTQMGNIPSMTFITAAATLDLNQQAVQVTATTAWAITLPNVTEAAGMWYSFSATILDSGAVTIQDNGDSANWTDLLLNADNDRCLLYSTGVEWFVIGAYASDGTGVLDVI